MVEKERNKSFTQVEIKEQSAALTVNGKRRGRPKGSKDSYNRRSNTYTKEVPNIVTAFLKKGYSRDVISAHLGISKDTFLQWRKKHPELEKAVEEGLIHSQLWWETLGIRAAQGKVRGFNASAWVFNMKNRFGWRDKTEVSGDEDKPISVRVVKFSEMQEVEAKVLEPEWRKIENLEPSEDKDIKELM